MLVKNVNSSHLIIFLQKSYTYFKFTTLLHLFLLNNSFFITYVNYINNTVFNLMNNILIKKKLIKKTKIKRKFNNLRKFFNTFRNIFNINRKIFKNKFKMNKLMSISFTNTLKTFPYNKLNADNNFLKNYYLFTYN